VAIQPNKPQNRVFLLVGIVLAAAAALAVLFAISRNSTSTPTYNVVVAKTTIPAGTAITADLLTTAALTQGGFPADSYTDPTQVVGKTAPVTLSANTPLYQSLFLSASGAAGATAKLDITKGYVALAIPAAGGTTPGVAAEQTSTGFYIQPEDHIDILIDGGTPTTPSVRYAFQDVRVLRVGPAVAAPAAGSTAAPAAGAVTSYTIELPRNQAEIMTALTTGHGGATGPTILKYVLRPQAEWGKRDGTNGFDKPIYEPNTGTPLTSVPDDVVTPSSLNALFAH
jgi:Flp pilus assembly protein CpaB